MTKYDITVYFSGRKKYQIEADSYYEAVEEAKRKFLEDRKTGVKGAHIGGYTSVSASKVGE